MPNTCWYDSHERIVQECLTEKSKTLGHSLPRCTPDKWEYDTVKFKVENDIAFVTLADMKTANGITPKNTSALFDVCYHLLKNPEIKVVVFTANGAYFCTGGSFAGDDPEQKLYSPQVGDAHNELESGMYANYNLALLVYLLNVIPQYKIAAIRGETMGAGNSLIAAMDYVVAPEKNCRLHFMETKMGIASCMTWQGAIAKVGAQQMQRLTLLGENITSQDAKSIGLVQEVLGNNAQANERAIAHGKEIAAKSHTEIRALKNSGPSAKFPLTQLPPAVSEGCMELQDTDPNFDAVIKEVMDDCGRSGRPESLRLSQDQWPHKSVRLTHCGQFMVRITMSNANSDNLIDKAMLAGLLDAVIELHKSVGKVRLVEVRAEGDTFCAGLGDGLSEDDAEIQNLLFLFSMLPMSVLGIVEGPARGFGVSLCSTFDLLAADSQKAKFVFDGVNTSECGVFACNRCGEKEVDELVHKKATLGAEEAKKLKLVTHIFNSSQECHELINDICRKVSLTAPSGVSVLKQFVQKMSALPLTVKTMKSLSRHVSTRMQGPEFADAVKSIMDKSFKPRYCRGREDQVTHNGI